MTSMARFHRIREGVRSLLLCSALLMGAIAQPAQAQTSPLSGTYAIGGSGADFADFNAAAGALDTRGIDGAVVFEIADGTYAESVTLGEVSGASATNTITFRAASGDSSAVVLEASGTEGNAPLRLDGTDHVQLERLTLQATNTSTSDSIHAAVLSGALDDVQFTGMQFLGPQQLSSDLSIGLYAAPETSGTSETTTTDLHITGSRFGASLHLESLSSNPATGTLIRGNIFETSALSFSSGIAIYLQDHQGPRITENTIHGFSNGITLQACSGGIRVLRNDLEGIDGGFGTGDLPLAGIVLLNVSSAADEPGRVANNEISGDATGLYLDGSPHQQIYHNSINTTSTATALTAINSDSTVVAQNNILTSGDGSAVNVVGTGAPTLDHNDLYTTGSTLVSWPFNDYADLAAYQSGTGQGANSVSVDPLFTSDADLTPSSRFLDDEGTDLTDVVPTDINRTERTPPVSIGAVEYSVDQPPLSAGTYTIGESGADYADLGSATEALTTRGIDGAVVFEVADGTYAESVQIGRVEGASATNTITFRAASGDSSAVVLEASGTEGNEPLRLDGTDHMRLEHLTLRAATTTDGTPARAAVLSGTLADVQFTGMQFLGNEGQNEEEKVGLYAEENTTTSELIIEGSRFGPSASGIYLGSNATEVSSGTVIRGNVFGDEQLSGPEQQAVYLVGHDGARVIANVVQGSQNGIALSSSGAVEITRNDLDVDGNGIGLSSSSGQSDNKGLVANNEITSSGNSTSRGIRVSSSDHQQIYHNSVNMTGSGTAFQGSSSSGTPVMNNVFASSGGFALRANRPDFTLNYNNLYTTGPVLVRYNPDLNTNTTDYAALASYQSGTGQGTNSVSSNPLFESSTDLTPASAFLDDEGTDLTGIVPADIRDAARTPPVAIGAVEFTTPTVRVTVQLDTRRLERLGLFSHAQGAPFVEVFDGSYPTVEYLHDADGDSTWTADVSLMPGEAVQYAFGIDPRREPGFPNDRILEWGGDAASARSLTVPPSGTTLDPVPFDDKPPVSVEPTPTAWIIERFEDEDPRPETFQDSTRTLLTLDLSALGRRMVVSARRYETDPGGSAPSDIEVVAPQGYWGIGHASTKTAYDATLTFEYGPLSGIRNPNHLRLLRRESADAPWEIVSASVDQSAETITATGLADIGGEWALGSTSDENPLTQIAPQVVSAPNPSDGGIVTSTETTLIGESVPDAHRYDLYLWEASSAKLSDSKPSSPTISDEGEPHFTWSSLQFGITYKWQIVAKNIYGETSGPVWTFAVNEAPDLTVSDLVLPNEGFSGQPITVDWQVSNAGNVGTNVPKWIDGIYLSADKTFDPDEDQELGTAENVSYLDAGEQYAGQAEVTLPRGVSGPHYVFVRTDAEGDMEESDKTNNRAHAALQITQSPYPDLEVTDLTVPSTAFSGDSIRVQWTVTNTGTAEVEASAWQDGFFLSENDELDFIFLGTSRIRIEDAPLGETTYQGPLPPDSSYTSSAMVSLPVDSVGTYHLFAFADVPPALGNIQGGEVYEADQELDNWAGDSIEVKLTPPPDLTVTRVDAPDQSESGETVDLSWTVANEGPGAVPLRSSSWNDAIYLSPSPSFDLATAQRLKVVTHTAQLGSDEESQASASVTLPDSARGDVYLAVVTDWAEDVFEHTYEDNNQAVAAGATSVTRAPYPDLQVANLSLETLEATAGQEIIARYDIQNDGTAAVDRWADVLYVSASESFDPRDARALTTAPSSDTLEAGAHRDRAVAVPLPADLPAGSYHLYVRADARDQAYEYPDTEGNTARSEPLDVDAYPPVDLSITVDNLPDSAAAGATLTPEIRVTNTGTGRTRTARWTDVFHLSRDSTIDESDTRLETTEREAPLDGGADYRLTPSLTLPNGIEGTYRLLAITDADGAVAEVDTSNNVAAPTITIRRPAPTDLRVASIDAPASTTSGQPVTVEWTVENAGTGSTRTDTWHDAVYLSRDLKISNGDVRLGTVEHEGDLSASETYRGPLSADLPLFTSGSFYILIRADERDAVYEHQAETNNVASTPIELTLQAPSDLVVTGIEAPSSAEAGRDVTVRWTLKNEGPNSARGTIREGVFISEDEAWDIEDPLLGIAERSISIEPGATKQQQTQVNLANAYKADEDGTITGSLPGIPPGDYHVIVRTDIANNIRETDDDNNRRTRGQPLTASIPSIALGASPTFSLDAAGDRYYRVDVPSGGQDLSFELSTEAADTPVELYLRRGAVPTPNTYDAKADAPFQSAQSIVRPVADAGTYYLLARARSVPAAGASFELSTEALSFEVQRATPDYGGNGGVVTTVVQGAQFEPGARLFLQADDGTRSAPLDSTYVVGSTRLFAPLNLRGQTPGAYDLIVQNPDGTEAVAQDAFTVEESDGAEPYVQYRKPSAIRSGTNLKIDVTVGNRGNEDAVDLFLLVGVRGYKGLIPVSVQVSDRHPYMFPDVKLASGANLQKKTVIYPFWFYSLPPGQEITFQLSIEHQIPQGSLTFAPAFGGMPASTFTRTAAPDDLSTSVGLQYMATFLSAVLEEDAAPQAAKQKVPTAEEATDRIQKGVTELAFEVGAPVPGTNEILAGPVARTVGLRRSKEAIERAGVESRVVDRMIDDAAQASDATAGGGPAGGTLVNARETFGNLIEDVFEGLEVAAPSGGGDQDDGRGGGGGGGGGDGGGGDECFGPAVQRGRGNNCFPPPDPPEPTDVKSSFDPNDILGPDGHGEKGWIAADQPLDYTIRFENDPELATAPAQVVEIRHPLDEDVDERTFELGSFGFGDFTFEVPDNRASYSTRLDVRDSLGVLVDVTAGLDVQTGEAFWRFTTIDPATGSQPTSDPTTGFLPVNDSTGRGEGFARYRIRPTPAAETGTEIEAQAEIVFDQNEPIETPTVTNTVDADPPTSRIVAQERKARNAAYRLRWTGSDPGAGIGRYRLYVAEGDGDFEFYASSTQDTSLTFVGDEDTSYRFLTRATDFVGNRETANPLATMHPAGLTAEAPGEAVELSWQPLKGVGIARYRIFRATRPIEQAPSPPAPVDSVVAGTTTYTDTTVGPGLTYYYRVAAVDSSGRTSRLSPQAHVFLYPETVRADIHRSFGGAEGPDDYRLVALPGAVDRSLAEAVPGQAGTQWQAYWDDGSEEDFLVKYDGSETFTFRPGRGFWLTSSQDWTADVQFTTVALKGDSAAAVPLHAGWNIVSNPTDKAVPFAAIQAVHADTLQGLWAFDGSFSKADTMHSGAAGMAYYFLNDAGLDSLVIPYPGAPAETRKAARSFDADTPALRLSARPAPPANGPASSVTVALDAAAAAGLDASDLIAPPGRFEPVSLRLEAPGEVDAKRQALLMVERRPPAHRTGREDGHTFDLRLTTQTGDPIQIEVDGLQTLDGRAASLLYPAAGKTFDLRNDGPITIEPDTDGTHLQLSIGTRAYVDDRKDQIVPEEVTLVNYPNPFREQTTVEYTLPEQTKVRLVLYDVLGRRVAILENSRKEAGRHRLQLESMGLASGIYFGRLQAGDETRTQKITVVR